MAKRPIFLISARGKSKEQLKTEAREAFLRFLAERKAKRPNGN